MYTYVCILYVYIIYNRNTLERTTLKRTTLKRTTLKRTTLEIHNVYNQYTIYIICKVLAPKPLIQLKHAVALSFTPCLPTNCRKVTLLKQSEEIHGYEETIKKLIFSRQF